MAFKMTNPLKNKYKYVNYGDEVLIDSTPEGNEPRLSDEKLKNEILNKMIDLSDQQYGTGIRKKFSPKQSGTSASKNK